MLIILQHRRLHLRRWNRRRKRVGIFAASAVNSTPRPVTFPGTNRRIAAWIRNRQRNAWLAVKRTWACRHWRCTCSPTSWRTVAASAANSFPGRGSCRVICALTPGKNRTVARTAAKRSRTGRIYALTCRRTPQTRTIVVPIVKRHSRSSRTSTNTRNPPVRTGSATVEGKRDSTTASNNRTRQQPTRNRQTVWVN